MRLTVIPSWQGNHVMNVAYLLSLEQVVAIFIHYRDWIIFHSLKIIIQLTFLEATWSTSRWRELCPRVQ